MVNGMNTNYNNYLVQNTGIDKTAVQAKLQSSKEAVVDNFSSNSVAQTISSTNDNGFAQVAPFLPFLYVLNKGIDSRMGGEVEKSSLSRIAKLGDKIYEVAHLDKIMSGDKISKLKNFLETNTFTKYFTNGYKANPKASMAKTTTMAENYASQLETQAEKVLSHLVEYKYSDAAMDQLRNAGKISSKTMQFFDNIGPLKGRLTPDFLTKVTGSLDDVASIATDQSEIISALKGNIQKFAAGADDITEQKLSSQIAAFFSQFKGEQFAGKAVTLTDKAKDVVSSVVTDKASTKQILDAVDDISANGFQVNGQKSLSIARNKLKAASAKIGKTPLGKLFAKGSIKTKDIITYGGDILSLYFMASSIMNASKASKEAPKGEKLSTFMHVLSEQYLGLILLQPSINLVYKAAGNKYRGMTTEGRKALADLVKNTNLDENLTREGLKVAKMQQKLLLKGVDKDKVATLAGKGLKEAKTIAKSLKGEGAKLKFWEKPLKKLGSLLGTGLDTLKKHKFITIKGKKIKLPHPTGKGFMGGLGRFLLIMMVVQPLLQKPITKLCHKIFGKPKTYLAKQEAANATPPAPMTNDNQPTNLIERYTKPAQNPYMQPQTPMYNPNQFMPQGYPQMPNAQQPINTAETPNASTGLQGNNTQQYIPSIVVHHQAEDTSAIDARAEALLRSTDKYIKNANKYM